MGGGIYLIQDDDRLVELMEQPYDSEDQIQELLETYPNLLAGDEVDRVTSRRWLLIARDITIPAEEDDGSRWSVDHLFLDQDSIPTIVVVKRSRNAEGRQKMIGQMLDYAANLALYWPIESIIAQFEANCREQGRDPEQVFEEFLGSDLNEDGFWQKVRTNLQAGKLRLVFVADDIANPLRRVVEFLNKQTDLVEVLALEIKQYVSQEGLKTLVPRLIGQTAEAQQKKLSAMGERRRWDEVSFFEEFQVRRGGDEAEMAEEIHNWAKRQEPEVIIQWGTGDLYGGFTALLQSKGRKPLKLFTVDISGRLEISSNKYGSQPPFDQQEKWLELRNKLSAIGLSLPLEPTEYREPTLQLSSLQDQSVLQEVLKTFDWVISIIKA
ncbi:hypothetical protein PCC9214_03500 [Planktothrix tepida]|uniref:DUF4268 domain-containing protein n=2 Tax=Planktothrix TaxID=54304 RepID=A0A1J1LSS4_9CYAN|nr:MULTISPECIES: hypothetical protein [Planktothrix]CAD5944702.1 hypothetical protein NO713_02153 [Planktothrix pseudagardhii]CAD5966049.1 hypothetical protein PCC9214_03500 [Planktothrix tepida]CUR35050.1 conserved hypothetical protein [Planktothrix tepida PCC 9214]